MKYFFGLIVLLVISVVAGIVLNMGVLSPPTMQDIHKIIRIPQQQTGKTVPDIPVRQLYSSPGSSMDGVAGQGDQMNGAQIHHEPSN